MKLRIPALYRDAVPRNWGTARRIAVSHPALDCRALEVLLAFALFAVAGEAAVITATPGRAVLLAEQWAHPKTRRVEGVTRLRLRTRTVWIAETPAAIPSRSIEHLFVDGAQALGRDPAHEVVGSFAGTCLCAGQRARGHWFDGFCAGADRLVTLEPAAVAAAFPDQAQRIGKRDVPFVTFARRRLKVRSDKRDEFLGPEQIAEARDQLGTGWASGRMGTPVLSFHLTPMQKRYLAIKRMAIRKGFNKFLLLKYRRGGFTTLEQALSYRMVATRPACHVTTLAHTDDNTRRIFRIASLFHARDSEAPRAITDSRTALELENGSYFFIGTAGGKGSSRGDTLQRVHGSECARWCKTNHEQVRVEDLIAGLVGAASHGEIVLETTPNGREWFCQTYTEAKQGQNDWYPIFLPWFRDPGNVARPGTYSEEEIRDTLTEEERNLKLSIPQIAFRRAIRKAYKKLTPQEYPEDDVSCFLTSGVCYFDTERLLWLVAKLPEYERKHLPGGYEVVWEEPKAGLEYCAGCDTSEGIPGCDPNGVGVVRRDNGAQVAAVHGLFNPRTLAEHAIRLSKRYNEALLGIERQNHGHAVLQKVEELGYARPHFRGGPLFYCHEGADLRSSRPGWDTSAITRPQLLDTLSDMLDADTSWVRDRDFVDECLTFRKQTTGDFEADPGSHDDRVILWGIAQQMRKQRRHRGRLTILPGEL